MDLGQLVRLYASHALWRATRLPAAGRALVRALSSTDVTVRELAGMFLVQGDGRSLPLLLDAVRKRENLPLVLTILADIGDMRLEPLFREFSTDEEAPVAQAARQGLETIRLRAHAPEAMP